MTAANEERDALRAFMFSSAPNRGASTTVDIDGHTFEVRVVGVDVLERARQYAKKDSGDDSINLVKYGAWVAVHSVYLPDTNTLAYDLADLATVEKAKVGSIHHRLMKASNDLLEKEAALGKPAAKTEAEPSSATSP